MNKEMRKIFFGFLITVLFLNAKAQNEPILVLDQLVPYEVNNRAFNLEKYFDKKEINAMEGNAAKAFEAITEKKFETAVKLFETYLDKGSDDKKLNFFCWFYKGYAHSQLGEWEDAEACFNKSKELDPNNPIVHFNLGVVNYKLTHWKSAKEGFTNALKGKPDFAEAYAGRGKVFFYTNGLNNAIQDYYQALRIAPQTDLYVYMIGISFLLRGNTVYDGNDTSLGNYYMYRAQQSQPLQVLLEKSEQLFTIQSL